MAKPRFVFPEGQCYDCHSCALCCPAYEIGVTAEEKQRLVEQRWEEDAALAGQPFFVERKRNTVLALGEGGSCVFLDDGNRCRIHAKFGEPTKPLGCRAYPFVLIPTDAEVRVSVRFDCPSVAANRGRPLADHRPWLEELSAQVLPPNARDLPPPAFRDGHRLEWPQLRRLTDALLGVLANQELSFTRRIIACVTMTHLLQRAKVDKLAEGGLKEFLLLSEEVSLKDASADDLDSPAPTGRGALLFRQSLALYGRRDLPGDLLRSARQTAARTGGRFRQALRFVRGSGAVPALQPDFPQTDFLALEEPLGEPAGESAEALLRFYTGKLTGMTFCGRAYYHVPFVEGLYGLWLTYPVALWYARLFARGDARASLAPEFVQRALRLVDWHHGRTPAFGTRSERGRAAFLSSEECLRPLVAWYGR